MRIAERAEQLPAPAASQFPPHRVGDKATSVLLDAIDAFDEVDGQRDRHALG
jgi:hypothetical protein